jgi:hypothetical protein
MWIIDCSGSLEITKLEDNKILIIFNDDNEWKYKNFEDKSIYLDYNDHIYKIYPDCVKGQQIIIDEGHYISKDDFIIAIKDNIYPFSDNQTYQCTLYFNQRGAGCGKTYESIQLIDNNEDFYHKNIFIYLTKMHSAKEVIYNELIEQSKRGDLSNIEIDESKYDANRGKQYKIKYINRRNNNDCEMIIGTIDSFIYACRDDTCKINNKNYFQSIVQSIRDGFINKSIKNGLIKYTSKTLNLNRRSLIIIDEAQDLEKNYVESIMEIMKETYVDAYIIGDKLQSIWDENFESYYNTHTYLSKYKEEIEKQNNKIRIISSEGKNNVMRFHNEKLKYMVNKVIDFDKYGLPSIEKICDNPNCRYKHENDKKPYTFFLCEKIYARDINIDKINRVIDKIIEYIKTEIDEYDYLPSNFMFIFPYLKQNILANQLESRLQIFWIEQFDDKEYQNRVLLNNEYWKNKINDNEYYEYVKLHKSDEGKSINLKESTYATRILSIHASKGNGCEVVFLLGMNEKILCRFCNVTGSLKYDSLLHVAITRQKKSIYIGFDTQNDDIWNRFIKFHPIEINKQDLPNLYISKNIKSDNIINYLLDHHFIEIDNKLISPYDYKNKLINKSDNNSIIDWGHHVIRYAVIRYQLMFNIYNNDKLDNYKDHEHFLTFIQAISYKTPHKYNYDDYYKKLNEISNNKKYNNTNKNIIIPILEFEQKSIEQTKYGKYCDILIDIIEHIQNKIKKIIKNNKLPILCPLEIVILYYMISVLDDGKYISDNTIMDIYSILNSYNMCSISIDYDKHDYSCKCKDIFKDNDDIDDITLNDIQNSIKNHYEKIVIISKMYKSYKIELSNKYNEEFRYNFNKREYSNAYGDKNFNIVHKYQMLAYSKNYVIQIIIKPQFNILNFNDIIFSCLIGHYILLNSNNERYINKKIITCIFTLDSLKPLIFELKLDKDNSILKNTIKEYLFTTFTQYHIDIYNFYKYHTESLVTGKINTMIDKLKKYDKNPDYIMDFFENIQLEHSKSNNKQLIKQKIQNLDDEDFFINQFNESLHDKIKFYLNLFDENEEII